MSYKTMRKRILAPLVALTLPLAVRGDAAKDAAQSGVPLHLATEVVARAAERGMPAQEALAPIAEAAQHGIPPDLVAAKVLEGLSKGVPTARIAAVARSLASRLASADEVLAEARRAGFAPPADRKAALLDLSSALGAGVNREVVTSLMAAARQAHSGSTDAVVSAAYTLGALARQGVPPSESMPLGLAIARKGPRPPAEIPALFETWRAEGGKDVRDFVGEAARRIEHGRKLDGMVDRFGNSPSRVVIERGADRDDKDRRGLMNSDVGKHGADQGVGPAEPSDDAARGALDDVIHGKSQGKGGPKPK